MRDLFAALYPPAPPVIERQAAIPAGAVFMFGGRPLQVTKTYGTDAAAPIIVEELTDAVTHKGQYGLWSADGVMRQMTGRGGSAKEKIRKP
jgi:hypothetical protein